MPDVTNILAELTADPLKFLRHYKLTIAGGDNNSASGIATFDYMDMNKTTPGFTTGVSGVFGVTKKRPAIRFNRMAVLDPHPNAAQGRFNAYYVAMKQVGDNAATTHFALPTAGGPDLMLTSMLTGCTFGVGSEAQGAQLVSHIQPSGDRTLLHDTMVNRLTDGVDGLFERENQKLYGDPGVSATVLAVRKNSHWTYYVQSYERLKKGAILEAKKIAG